jgi:hypothetical protein
MRRERPKLIKLENKKGDLNKHPTKSRESLWINYFENLYSNTLENLEKWVNL